MCFSTRSYAKKFGTKTQTKGVIKTTNAELNRIRNYAKNEKEPHFILGVMLLEELLEIQRLLQQGNADKGKRGRRSSNDGESEFAD